MPQFKLVNTDNFGGDYPDEKFLTLTNTEGKSYDYVCSSQEHMDLIATALNAAYRGTESNPASRYWKVVPADYVLQPGFEP